MNRLLTRLLEHLHTLFCGCDALNHLDDGNDE